MKNLNKHRKAITEAGYTLSKDGTQVTNKSGKTVAGTNDNGFFSGSSTLTKIFKGDTKAKEKAPAKSPKKAPAKTASKTSKRPPSKKSASTSKGSGDKYAPPESPNKAPRISAKPKGRNYTSASPAGTPTLMSQGGRNAETTEKGPERPGAFSVPKPEPREKGLLTNAKGEKILGSGTKPDDDGGIKGVTWPEYEAMTTQQRRRRRLPTDLDKKAWDLRLSLGG